jgi:hypothetical protein
MSGRWTLVMLVVAVGAAAYVYGFAIPRQVEQEAADAREKKLVTLAPDQIVRLELPLTEPEGASAKLVREPGSKEWRIESPRALRADGFVVEQILTSLEQLQIELTIEDPPADRTQFGIEASKKQVEIVPQSGDPIRLVLGGEAPVGSLRYVEASTRPGVVLGVTAGTLGDLEPNLEKLRDKQVIALEPKQVKQLQVEVGGKPLVAVQRAPEPEKKPEPDKSADIQIVNEAGRWELTQPIAEQADAERVFRYLQDVHFARVDAFVDEPGPLAGYGLARPEARVRLIPDGEGASPVEIALGRDKDKKVFARVNGEGPVLEVPARVLDGLPRDVFDYRYKRVFEVQGADVARIQLEFPRDAATHAFKRSGETWEPESSEMKIQAFRVGDLLYELDRVNATGLIEGKVDLPKLGLEPPRVKVTVFDKDNAALGWLALGDSAANQGTAARSSMSERTWRVVNDIGEKIPLGLAAFESSWLQPEPPAASTEGAPAAKPEGDTATQAPPAPSVPSE